MAALRCARHFNAYIAANRASLPFAGRPAWEITEMTRLLMLAALGAVFAGPALAQYSDGGQNAERQRRSTVPPGGIYYSERGGKADTQDQNVRWKTNHKPKPRAKHRAPRK
jgi:hypothetical protein